jgi:cytochrome P450
MAYIGGEMARNKIRYIEYANEQITQRKQAEQTALNNPTEKAQRKDFFHYLLSARDRETGKGLTKEERDAESGMLISAGADTTSIVLAGFFFYMIHNPFALSNATKEIRSTFSDVEDIVSGPKLNSLIYTRACVDETLRLCPPAAAHLPREVLTGGLTVDGHFFPKGTAVGTSAYAIHHNPEYFPEPFAFKPERWIPSSSKSSSSDDGGVSPEDLAKSKSAFCAFSLGTRGCIGKSLAYLELTLAIARALWCFDIRKPEGSEGPSGEGDPKAVEEGRRRVDEYQLRDFFLDDRQGPCVEFRWRVDVDVDGKA